MSIFEYNGGTLVGMVGKDCVGIAADRRFGKQMLTLANDFQRVFKLQDNLIMGLSGLGTDIQTFSAHMEQKLNLYTLKENKLMKPITFCNLVAYSLFEKRYPPLHAGSAAISFNPSSQASRTANPSSPATTPSAPNA
jgi:20S proteasome subunit beta 3